MKHAITHETFVIERVYDTTPERVFAAWASAGAKSAWFGGPDEWLRSEHKLDFREGGTESLSAGPKGGAVHAYRAIYHDIVPNERFVLSYEMHVDETRISVSLASIEVAKAGGGTRLVYTEHGAYLDGYDNAGKREEGTRGLLENLDTHLKHSAA